MSLLISYGDRHDSVPRELAKAESSGNELVVIASTQELAHRIQMESGISVRCCTLLSWIEDRWSLLGDGRAIVGSLARNAIIHEVVSRRIGKTEGLPFGRIRLTRELASRMLPWLAGTLFTEVAPSTRELVDDALRYGELLHSRGFVERVDAMAALPALLDAAGYTAHLVFVGFSELPYAHRRMLCELSRERSVVIVLPEGQGPGHVQVERLEEELRALHAELIGADGISCEHADAEAAAPASFGSELEELRWKLFRVDGGAVPAVERRGAVGIISPAGPVAEAEALARCIDSLVEDLSGRAPDPDGGEAPSIVLCVPDVAAAWRTVAPKLHARGMEARAVLRPEVLEMPSVRSFLGFVRSIHDIAVSAAASEGALSMVSGDDALATLVSITREKSLGDMYWWPAQGVLDFLLCDWSGVSRENAWAMDSRIRSDRTLRAEELLSLLCTAVRTSPVCASACRDVIAGRIGKAARTILDAYTRHLEDRGDGVRWSEAERLGVLGLQSIVDAVSTLEEFGSIDGKLPAEHASAIEATLLNAASPVRLRYAHEPGDDACTHGSRADVLMASANECARMEPSSADALVYAGLDTARTSVDTEDEALSALFVEIGAEREADALAKARSAFAARIAVPRERLVLEYLAHQENGGDSFPAAMLSELMSCYPYESVERPWGREGISVMLPTGHSPETDLHANLSISIPIEGASPSARSSEGTVPSTRNEGWRSLVGLKGDASRRIAVIDTDGEVDGADVVSGLRISASQIENYMDCPYKWFASSRLMLSDVEADMGPATRGTFAHAVLERCMRRMHEQGLSLESHLDQAHAVLDDCFAELVVEQFSHEPGNRSVRTPYVSHDLVQDHAYFELHRNLHNYLEVESGRLQGFVPSFFEYRFGHLDADEPEVEFCGARIAGVIDRIDIDPLGRAMIVDYKSTNDLGRYTLFRSSDPEAFVLPDRVQALVYAWIARKLAREGKLPGVEAVVGAVYRSFGSSADSSGAFAVGEGLSSIPIDIAGRIIKGRVKKDGTFYATSRAARCAVPAAGIGSFDELLDRVEELLEPIVGAMIAGADVSVRPRGTDRDTDVCRFCPRIDCERRRV
ncbi:MAG: PD-(D/E)XK nuclease family protein [Atopobiaceae bacterium]|nr:PD-(D/E)XK nuclease family protein [Atopobiaceae bacterium]